MDNAIEQFIYFSNLIILDLTEVLSRIKTDDVSDEKFDYLESLVKTAKIDAEDVEPWLEYFTKPYGT